MVVSDCMPRRAVTAVYLFILCEGLSKLVGMTKLK